MMLVTSTFVFGAEMLNTPFRAEIVTSTVRSWHTRAAARAAKASGRAAEIKWTIAYFLGIICCVLLYVPGIYERIGLITAWSEDIVRVKAKRKRNSTSFIHGKP